MIRTALASTALFAAHALGLGSAVVINSCGYDVYMANTPSADGVHTAVNQVLSAGGGEYSQVWTQLNNDDGWSIKLSKSDQFGSDIMQYEYTYHNDQDIIWFDISDVNGNPWDGNWEITATDGCQPRHAAYRFSTDDAYGMQACSADASITVTLCSGTSGGGHTHPHPHHHHHHHHKPPPPPVSSPPESGSPTTSAALTTSQAVPATTAAPTSPTTTTTYYNTWNTWGGGPPEDKVEAAAGGKKKLGGKGHKSPTTFVTASSPNGPAVTVTNMKYETVVKYITATA